MKINVVFVNERSARVVFTPSLVERVFFGKQHEERRAVRGAAAIWRWDCVGHYVGDRVQRAIERTWWREGRPPSVVKATAPPG